MGSRRIISSNMDTFIRFTCYLIRPPTYFLESSDIRKVLYLYKAFDVFWFNTFLPVKPEEKIIIFLNPEWPSERPPYGIDQLAEMDEITLRYLTDRLTRPLWIPNGIKFTLSIADILGSAIRPEYNARSLTPGRS